MDEILRSDLVDLSGIDLEEIAELPDSALGHALRRLMRDFDDPAGTYFLGHDSSLPGVITEKGV
ncbi:FxSxx-COOH protein [Nonomuraea sp. NBC_01738]|uniref:FxSxx-COOH cyclophane-containing RiPP peptide n=1 Tax=Nonomuraea sp. NBC_01738 TaxID=2976003 RepID=UPI002E1522A0|nr:FxSxx-COOH protein [Nonomuraea sp. NBC_01738]